MASSSISAGEMPESIAPIDLILCCAVCNVKLKDLRKEDRAGMGIGVKDSMPVRMWLTDCGHLVCSEHFAGGGAPFHQANELPRAPCPWCGSNDKPEREAALYWVHGPGAGEYDSRIPSEYFAVLPVSHDTGDVILKSLRFQFLNLARSNVALRHKVEQLEAERSRPRARKVPRLEPGVTMPAPPQTFPPSTFQRQNTHFLAGASSPAPHPRANPTLNQPPQKRLTLLDHMELLSKRAEERREHDERIAQQERHRLNLPSPNRLPAAPPPNPAPSFPAHQRRLHQHQTRRTERMAGNTLLAEWGINGNAHGNFYPFVNPAPDTLSHFRLPHGINSARPVWANPEGSPVTVPRFAGYEIMDSPLPSRGGVGTEEAQMVDSRGHYRMWDVYRKGGRVPVVHPPPVAMGVESPVDMLPPVVQRDMGLDDVFGPTLMRRW
ncbi:Hypothetical protein D9617_12g037440 [Elsinoe fawcettii]|nr:Hypothetical protein D9617_12g037440 [Elsinoe fawcettii]